jgi:hypothetical protein
MKRPAWSAGRLPQIGHSSAESSTRSERGIDGSAPCSGPPISTRYAPPKIAIQFSMIVVMTSWAPTVAFRIPAMPPQIPPITIAARSAMRMCSGRGVPSRFVPT